MKKTNKFKYRFKHLRNERVLKSVIYKGFRITVYRDKTYGMPYLAVTFPINSTARKVTIDKRKQYQTKIPDYTGWITASDAIIDKKTMIDAMYRCRNYRFHFWSFGVD